MANAVLLSKFIATNHEHPAIHRLPPRLPSFNLRLTPRLHLSGSSLQTTNAKSSSVIRFQPMNHKKADASPIWVDPILKPLKRCAIPLVIMPLLLMSYPYPGRACAWDTVSQIVALDCALSEPEPEPESKPEPKSMAEKIGPYLFVAYFILCVLTLFQDGARALEHDWGTTSVLKLQVGLLGQASPLQTGLKLVDSASSEVRRHVLKETARALLCNPDYCISAHSCVHIEEGINEGIMKLHQLYTEEQEKFEGQRHNPTSLGAGGDNNDYIVVTILVAALGEHTIPTIEGRKDLNNALKKLESIRAWRIEDLKVLWTPQAENDTIRENFLKVPTLEASRKNSTSVYLNSALKKLVSLF